MNPKRFFRGLGFLASAFGALFAGEASAGLVTLPSHPAAGIGPLLGFVVFIGMLLSAVGIYFENRRARLALVLLVMFACGAIAEMAVQLTP